MMPSFLEWMAAQGPTLVRLIQEPADWDLVSNSELGRECNLTPTDVEDLSSPAVFDYFRPLVANAVLTLVHAPDAELDRGWEDVVSLQHLVPPSRRTEPMTVFWAIDLAKLDRAWALDALSMAGWSWDAARRRTRRPPQKGLGEGNRPRELLTHLVLALYDERHATWCERTGKNHVNAQGVRKEIGHALRWFFLPGDLDPAKGEPIHNAIHNSRPKGPQRR